MRTLLFVLLVFWSSVTFAESSALNLTMPSASQSYQNDRIRAGELDCQNAIGSSTNLEFGVVGVINQDQSIFQMPNQTDNFSRMGLEDRDIGVYARLTIPIGGPKERINCNTLYQLELTKKRLEVEKLQLEVNKLRSLRFEELK